MKLHPVKHGPRRNRYCGPAALSAVTGMLTDDTAALLRKLTGRSQIKSTSSRQMERAFNELGYAMTEVFGFSNLSSKNDWRRPTLAGWLKMTPRPAGKVFLVSAGSHWQLVSGRSYVCGITIEIVSVRDKRVKRRSRVRAAWEITKP